MRGAGFPACQGHATSRDWQGRQECLPHVNHPGQRSPTLAQLRFLRLRLLDAESFHLRFERRGFEVESFRGAHGRWLDEEGTPTGVLRIEAVEVREVSPPVALLSYEEWQELPGGTVVRLSSVLFRENPAAPGGVEWVHLHEGWLPGHAPVGQEPAVNGE